jgi:hypothetical protein
VLPTTSTRRRLALLVTAAGVLLPATAAPAAPAGYERLVAGATQHGQFELSAKHQRIGGDRGLCLDLSETFADGSSPGSGGGCFSGSLKAGGNVAPVSTTASAGGTVTSSLVGGIVPAATRRVVVRFADGAKLTIKHPLRVAGWGRALGVRVRYYAADALATTAAAPKAIRAYDGHGKRIGKRAGG